MTSFYEGGWTKESVSRTTTSFGVDQDANFFYSYSPRGEVTKTAKSSAEEYYWFLTRVVLYGETYENLSLSTAFPNGAGGRYINVDDKIPTRQTPETDEEKISGIGKTNIFAIAHSELPVRVKGQYTKSGSHGLIVPALKEYMNNKMTKKKVWVVC